MWIMVLILTFLFASLHQTSVYSFTSSLMVEADTIRATIMIWVTFHLALHQDCQEYLRDEVSSILSSRELNDSNPVIDVQTMQDAVKTDSFIREVLRMKGDLVNLVRAPVRDIELGGYIIPKGGNPNSIFIVHIICSCQLTNS
jgi:cytochrome P450